MTMTHIHGEGWVCPCGQWPPPYDFSQINEAMGAYVCGPYLPLMREALPMLLWHTRQGLIYNIRKTDFNADEFAEVVVSTPEPEVCTCCVGEWVAGVGRAVFRHASDCPDFATIVVGTYPIVSEQSPDCKFTLGRTCSICHQPIINGYCRCT